MDNHLDLFTKTAACKCSVDTCCVCRCFCSGRGNPTTAVHSAVTVSRPISPIMIPRLLSGHGFLVGTACTGLGLKMCTLYLLLRWYNCPQTEKPRLFFQTLPGASLVTVHGRKRMHFIQNLTKFSVFHTSYQGKHLGLSSAKETSRMWSHPPCSHLSEEGRLGPNTSRT